MCDRVHILYDSRSTPESPGDASILVVCEDREEALSYRGDFGGMTCFSYAEKNGDLFDEEFSFNWYPGMKTKGAWEGD